MGVEDLDGVALSGGYRELARSKKSSETVESVSCNIDAFRSEIQIQFALDDDVSLRSIPSVGFQSFDFVEEISQK